MEVAPIATPTTGFLLPNGSIFLNSGKKLTI